MKWCIFSASNFSWTHTHPNLVHRIWIRRFFSDEKSWNYILLLLVSIAVIVCWSHRRLYIFLYTPTQPRKSGHNGIEERTKQKYTKIQCNWPARTGRLHSIVELIPYYTRIDTQIASFYLVFLFCRCFVYSIPFFILFFFNFPSFFSGQSYFTIETLSINWWDFRGYYYCSRHLTKLYSGVGAGGKKSKWANWGIKAREMKKRKKKLNATRTMMPVAVAQSLYARQRNKTKTEKKNLDKENYFSLAFKPHTHTQHSKQTKLAAWVAKEKQSFGNAKKLRLIV